MTNLFGVTSALHRSISVLAAACLMAILTGMPAAVDAQVAGAKNNNRQLEEIVVTARYREENLQETPIALTALSGNELDVRGFGEIQDIGLSIPNAFFRPGNAATGPSPTIGIRGVSQFDFNFALEPGVGVYIDDIYHGTLTGASFDLLDVERVEVLRGPQGTLFGKNSLGGAVRIVSKKPEGDNTGHIEATYGSYDRIDVKGSYDFSIIEDKLFMRVAATSKHREGYQDQLDFRCQMIANGTPELAGIGDGVAADGPDGNTDPDLVAPGSAADNAFSFPGIRPGGQQSNGDCKIGTTGGKDIQAGRVMLRWLPSNDLEVNLAAEYTDDNSEAVPYSLMTADTDAGTDGFRDTVYQNYGIGYGDGRFLTGDPYKTYETYADPITGQLWPNAAAVESWGVSGTVDYDISPAMSAKAILGYRTYNSQFTSQGDGSPLKESVLYNDLEHDQFSAELRLTGVAFNERLEWTLGGFYYDADSYLGGRAEFNTNGLMFDNNDNFNTENKSVFMHLAFDVTDSLALSGGLRYTDEKKSYLFDHTGFLTVTEPSVASQSRVDWKVGLDYKLTEDAMAYASVSTGFRSAGFQPRPFTEIQLRSFPEEELISYEIGLKSDWLDNRLRTNLAVFYSDYDPRVVQVRGFQCEPNSDEDQQPVLTPPPCPAGTFFAGGGLPWAPYISGPATIKGVEAEVSANPIEGLTINGTMGYNDFDSEQDDPTAPNYFHPEFLIQPEWNASAGIEYDFRLSDLGRLTPRLDWFYQSKMTYSELVNVAPGPTDTIDAYSVFNGRLTYQPSNGNWSAVLSVTNLFNKFYWYSFRNSDPEGREGVPARPREWALTFRYDF